MRSYRLKIPSLSNNRIDQITAALHQYDEYIQAVEAPGSTPWTEKGARRRLSMIEAAADACGWRDTLIAVCCRQMSPPISKPFNKARRAFYLLIDRELE